MVERRVRKTISDDVEADRSGGIPLRGTAELSGVGICIPEQPSYARCAPATSASAAVSGVASCGRMSKAMTDNEMYVCGDIQTMSHIVDSCPLDAPDIAAIDCLPSYST